MVTSERRRLSLVHSFRAFAVLFILLGHANKVFHLSFDYQWFNVGEWLRTGGIDFFFIVTGFMMFYLYHKNFGIRGKAKDFLIKRISKIYPVYWLFTLATLAAVIIFPAISDGHEKNPEVIIKSLLLIPTDPIIEITWSLSYVVFFYLVFSLVIYKPKIFKPVVFVWVLILIFNQFKLFPANNSFFLNISHLEIITGAIIAYIVMNYKLRFPYLYLTAGFIGYLLVWSNNIYGFYTIRVEYFYWLSAAFMMLGITLIDMKKDTILPKSITLLGDASYSIFISQMPVFHFYALLLGKLQVINLIGGTPAMLLAIVLTILSGCLVYKVFEKPVTNFFKNVLLHKKAASNFKSLPVK